VPPGKKKKIRLFIWDLSNILTLVLLMTVNFPFRTAYAVSHRFWQIVFSFSFASRNFFISFLISLVTQWFFKSVLFGLHAFYDFPCHSFLILFYYCLLGYSGLVLFFFLSLLRFALWSRMWSILVKVPQASKKNM
jgi:hypothetical protein